MELAAPRSLPQIVEVSIDVCAPDRGHAIATYRNLLLMIWTEHMTLAEIKNAGRSMLKLSECYPSGIVNPKNELHEIVWISRDTVVPLTARTTARSE